MHFKMANNYFSFKQFTVYQDRCSFKAGTDSVLLGAYADIYGAEKILDIGTGTGLISLMLAQRCSARIIAIEPDYDSYKQACENISNSKWNERIEVRNTDLQNFNQGSEKFDLVVTNPPYFIDSLKNPDSRRAASRHNVTLSSEEILNGATDLIAENGRLQIILPYIEGNIFIEKALRYGFFCNSILKIKPQPASKIRRLILGFSKRIIPVTGKYLTIENGKRHEFTDEYINLTKDFYLNF
jgi:tRNA1Val (adenine37-N6)-methyltransferase